MRISMYFVLLLLFLICRDHHCMSLSHPKSLRNRNIVRSTNSLASPVNKFQLSSVPVKSVSQVLITAKNAAFRGGMNGFLAACLQVLSLMWLRTIINYQYRYGVTFVDAFSQLYNQGGVMRFYRGVTYAIIQAPLSRFGVIAAQEGVKVLLTHFDLNSPVLTSLVVTLASTLWRVLLVPLDTCKTVLQVQGSSDFALFLGRVLDGELHLLYEGATATMAITFVSHYLLFYTQEFLETCIPKPPRRTASGQRAPLRDVLLRSALIGFASSVVSDSGSNLLRVIKTIKQTTTVSAAGEDSAYFTYSGMKQLLSFSPEAQRMWSQMAGLATRGLLTRLAANGLQMVLFTVVWKLLQERSRVRREISEGVKSTYIDAASVSNLESDVISRGLVSDLDKEAL